MILAALQSPRKRTSDVSVRCNTSYSHRWSRCGFTLFSPRVAESSRPERRREKYLTRTWMWIFGLPEVDAMAGAGAGRAHGDRTFPINLTT